jgi:hypothetical protein
MDPCLIIIAREHPDLLPPLRDWFAKRKGVEIFLDRRSQHPQNQLDEERRDPAQTHNAPNPFLVII